MRTFPVRLWTQTDVGEQLAKSVSTLADSVSRRPGLLAANLSRRKPLLASTRVYVGKLLHLAGGARRSSGGAGRARALPRRIAARPPPQRSCRCSVRGHSATPTPSGVPR